MHLGFQEVQEQWNILLLLAEKVLGVSLTLKHSVCVLGVWVMLWEWGYVLFLFRILLLFMNSSPNSASLVAQR